MPLKSNLKKGKDKNRWHLVSGNREFAYQVNPNESFTFYTKGCDKYFLPLPTSISNDLFAYISEMIAFTGADALWDSFQDGIELFINSHQGSATKLEPVRSTPDWGKVKNALKGQSQITCIPIH